MGDLPGSEGTDRGSVRLLHTADVHLGARDDLFGEAAERVREARRRFVRELPELAARHGCAGVVVAGDLFDGPAAFADEGKYLSQCLEGLARDGRWAVLTPGTHDGDVDYRQLGPAHVLDRADFAGEVVVEVAGRALHFLGGAYDPVESPDDFLAPLKRGRDEGLHVAVLHAALVTGGSRFDRRELPVTADELAECGCDYVALGHYHTFQTVEVGGRVVGAYPGTPVPRRFQENGRRRVVLVEFAADGVLLEPLFLEGPWADSRSLDVTGITELDRLVTECLRPFREEKAEALVDLLLELRLRGTWELAPESPEDLRQELSSRVAGLRLYDDTHRLDAAAVQRLAGQRTPEGMFVALLRDRQREAPEGERRAYERALMEVLALVQEVRRGVG